jgi:hypothetical protein
MQIISLEQSKISVMKSTVNSLIPDLVLPFMLLSLSTAFHVTWLRGLACCLVNDSKWFSLNMSPTNIAFHT